MNTQQTRPHVGAPDPERKTSPIFEENDREEMSFDAELEEGLCYFNDQAFQIGDYACSGDEQLRCEQPGVWIRQGNCVKE